MAETGDSPASNPLMPGVPVPTLEDLQHWTWVMGRAQQLMMEHVALQVAEAPAKLAAAEPKAALGPWGSPALPGFPAFGPGFGPGFGEAGKLVEAQTELWTQGLSIWQRALGLDQGESALKARADKDRRFASPEWRDNPVFDMIRQSYLLVSDRLLGSVDALEGIGEEQREQLRFATRLFVDAMSPSNFALTNPQVIERTIASRGDNLLKGLEHMLADLGKGQLTHTAPDVFEVGRNIASTPGKVVKRTPLYELIQYSPTTDEVYETPVIVFPPWINRFYILDLNAEKSFIKWAVDSGLTMFIVSWKSADASLAETVLDDYVRAQIEAIDSVRDLLGVEDVHTIGYCVAGTTLATTLALLEARDEADKVASGTFFTAQVDFSEAGDLKLFTNDGQMKLIDQLSNDGYLDGRYMAATFNLLRGRDLIWNYVTNNYLLGQDYPPYDLLFWNGDTTNLPTKWHQAYLKDLYRDNKLVQPGAITVDGTPINIAKVRTPTYVQAGREDHIAPAASVWKITHHFQGPLRFVLAGSGHVAGVVNPPAAGKYQYWTNEEKVETLDEFIAGATETKGSWWPDWLGWIDRKSDEMIPAKGARIPGKGKLKALEDAPGSYVRAR
ncbi:PHA/PHB synthase family protein [Sphingomonas sp.]|uniref:PHA/PHB synthase family protein n=1 Tax=Sphingomonas sp. TaxID=28214 RepID=UPI002FCB6A25